MPKMPTRPEGMDPRTIQIMMNNTAINSTVMRSILTVMLSGLEVTEERVLQVAESFLTPSANEQFRKDMIANIQDVLTTAEMLRGGQR
jgi:hypothetical protein